VKLFIFTGLLILKRLVTHEVAPFVIKVSLLTMLCLILVML